MKIQNFTIDSKSNVFIIAELSANHGGSLEIAIETIKAAKRAGADCIKLQTAKPELITLDSKKDDFKINRGTIWDGKYLFDLYSEVHTPWVWHKTLMETAAEEGLVCFSSPFDKTAVDFLEELEVPAYKIASFEITDISLIEYVASKGKPIILSTGIAEREDIELAVEACHRMGNRDIALLKCTSSYPTPLEEANLVMMQRYAKDFNVQVGVSDHTLGITVPVVATALGAKIIEKHLILDKSIGGPDVSFSLDEKEFTEMVNAVRNTEKALGKVSYDLTENQKSGKAFSRSLYVSEDIMAGEIFTEKNVRSVRPGFGLHPKYLQQILGEKASENLYKGDRFELRFIL